MTTQSAKYSPLFAKIYQSRNILISILKDYRGFDTEKYENFSTNELRSICDNKQLDMLLENKETGKKIYIKYCLDTKVKSSHIYEFIEDLFEIENILTNDDELIIVTKDSFNDTLRILLKQIYVNDNKFINIYDINRYLVNILKHDMVPKHIILTQEEKETVLKEFYISDDSKLPEISRFDPVASCIGLRPGEMVKIIRSSPTAITSLYYRICV